MKKISLAFTLLISSLSASPITYYALDNKTTISSDDVFNDPFLALRTKSTGRNSSYSPLEAWNHLANFSCPEWDDEFPVTIDEETEATSTHLVTIVNDTTIFDHTTPCFTVVTDAKDPETSYWQISDSINFSRLIPNFDEIQPFTKHIELSRIDETFLNPEDTYYFRVKVCGDRGWTEWSEPFAFQVLKPRQPQGVACDYVGEGQYELSWEADPDPSTHYIVFGGIESAFIPCIYGERCDNITSETDECEITLDGNCSYYRVVAVRHGSYSVPSELVVAVDFSSLLEELQPSFGKPVTGYPYNSYVDKDIWNKLTPYFLPTNHPIKHKLDKIFKGKKRVLQDTNSLKKAGFRHPKARQWTRLIVTSHKKLPGYIIKLYTDHQHPHRGRPEWVFWTKRIRGVALIQKSINERQLHGIFKTPKKWIYPVPHESKPEKTRYRKNFILVEQDMDIFDDKTNERRWRSAHVTAEKLDLLFEILQEHGLWDCPKPANIPFGRDGRIAFIDTQTYHTWPVKHFRLTPFLSVPMQTHWNQLIKSIKQ